MKNRLVILLLVSIPILTHAQELRRNNLYVELAGASKYYSVNYERLLLSNDEYNITLRGGLMYLYIFDASDHTIAGIPIGASYLKQYKNDYFEAGVSFALIRDMYTYAISPPIKVDELILMSSIRAGIRHQPKDKNLFWNLLAQISMTAHSESEIYKPYTDFFPLFSAGVGYSF